MSDMQRKEEGEMKKFLIALEILVPVVFIVALGGLAVWAAWPASDGDAAMVVEPPEEPVCECECEVTPEQAEFVALELFSALDAIVKLHEADDLPFEYMERLPAKEMSAALLEYTQLEQGAYDIWLKYYDTYHGIDL